MDLFTQIPLELYNTDGAQLNDDRSHRFALWRVWDPNKPMIMFIGLNPSTANESQDDPTIRRVKKFAADWGYGGVFMLNLFTFVTAYPDELPISSYNDLMADELLRFYAKRCDKVIFAWGSFKEARERAKTVIKMFPEAYALHINANGSPKHPLYVRGNVKPIFYHQLSSLNHHKEVVLPVKIGIGKSNAPL